MKLKSSVVVLACLSFAGVVQANESVSLLLNWVAGGDHAPYYYAQKMVSISLCSRAKVRWSRRRPRVPASTPSASPT